MKDKRRRIVTIGFNIKRLFYYSSFVFVYPYFCHKKNLKYLHDQIESLEKFKIRMKIIAKHNQQQLESVCLAQKNFLTPAVEKFADKIIKEKITDKNIASANFSIEQFLLLLERENIDAMAFKEFEKFISSGIVEFTSLFQTYYSIVGSVYSKYKKFPKSIPFYISKFSKLQVVEW